MKKQFLRLIGLLLCLSVLLSNTVILVASAEQVSGTCGAEGDNLTWELDTDTGELTISGSGAMEDYSLSTASPWYSYRSSIKTVNISDGVTNIGDYTFYECKNLMNIEIPIGITSIGNFAFRGCGSLTEIEIPMGVTRIGSTAFSRCSSLLDIRIPTSVTWIGPYAFNECNRLTNIEIPTSVTWIGSHAFSECSCLTNIEIPISVKSIGNGAFFGCNNLSYIAVAQGNAVYHSIDNCLIETAAKVLIAGCKNSKIPTDGSVTSIGDYAFSGFTDETSLTLPEGLTSVGIHAFEGCTGLTSLVLPKGLTSIGNFAFRGCTGLTSLTFPEGLTSIGNSAFSRCTGLMNLTFPDGLISIGTNAFTSCADLSVLTFLSPTTTIGNFSYAISTTSTTIYGYAGSTAEAFATQYNHIFIPFATDTSTVFEFTLTFTPTPDQVGVYTPVATLNRVGAESSETLDFLYIEESTGTLVIKDAEGIYQTLRNGLGRAITVGETETAVAVIYDNVNGLFRYYINGYLAYYGTFNKATNDIPVYNPAFCALEAVTDSLTTLDTVTVSNIYNINESGTSDFIGIQQKEGDTSALRILAGIDMLYYGSMGFDVELFRDGQSLGTIARASSEVYTGITAGGETVTADNCGYRYFSMLTIEGIDTGDGAEYYFVVRPFTEVATVKYYGQAKKIDISTTGFTIDETYTAQ